MEQIGADGDHLFHRCNVFFPRFRQHNGIGVPQEDGSPQVFFHRLDGLAQGRLGYVHGLGSIGDAPFLDDFHNILRMFQVHNTLRFLFFPKNSPISKEVLISYILTQLHKSPYPA
jgi:hypothetical protein